MFSKFTSLFKSKKPDAAPQEAPQSVPAEAPELLSPAALDEQQPAAKAHAPMPESFAAAPYAFEAAQAAQAAGAIEPQTAETTLAGAEPEPAAAAPIADTIADIEPPVPL
ncbi:MAG TPA: hypothetical protein PK129_17800, partial [Cellvibrionaceae bacterium]|nr:hypothetical protein [Cellvibrionaceae bacterium]